MKGLLTSPLWPKPDFSRDLQQQFQSVHSLCVCVPYKLPPCYANTVCITFQVRGAREAQSTSHRSQHLHVYGTDEHQERYLPCLAVSSLTLSMVESLLACSCCLLLAGLEGEVAGGERVEVEADFTRCAGEEWREEVLEDSLWMSGEAWEEVDARVGGGLSVGTEDDLPRCLEGEAWVVLPGSPSLDPIMPRVALHCLCNTRRRHVSHNTHAHTLTLNVPLLNSHLSCTVTKHRTTCQRGAWC